MTTQISPTPCVILPPDGSLPLSQFLSYSSTFSLNLSLSVLTILHPLFVSFALIFLFVTPLSLSLFSSLCSTESNGDRPSPTGLCWRPTLRRWSVSPISSTPSLAPSVPFPLPSPFLFVTSVDTVTGRDSRTSEFPPGLGYFTLGRQRDFRLTWLYTPAKKSLIPKVHRELRIWTCHSLLHERWHRPLITTAFCLTSALINTV